MVRSQDNCRISLIFCGNTGHVCEKCENKAIHEEVLFSGKPENTSSRGQEMNSLSHQKVSSQEKSSTSQQKGSISQEKSSTSQQKGSISQEKSSNVNRKVVSVKWRVVSVKRRVVPVKRRNPSVIERRAPVSRVVSVRRVARVSLQDDKIVAVWWGDRRNVLLLSTMHNDSVETVLKCPKGSCEKKAISCPVAIIDYNNYMGAVDLMDQHLSYYSLTTRQTLKWWKRYFGSLWI